MGMLASASIGDGTGFFEPIHGSAHNIAGQNKANPLASILSVASILDIAFGLRQEAEAVRDAITETLRNGWRTPDIANANTPIERVLGTQEIGQKVIACL